MINKLIGALFIMSALYGCGCGNNKNKEEKRIEDTKPLASQNTAAFNQSFETLLASYDKLKMAFVEYDTVAANAAALQVASTAGDLKIQEIKGDSTGAIKETAASYSAAIGAAAKEIPILGELEKKKRQFQTISDAMYNLVRTVKYDQQKIYRQHCPMAFNDEEEAYWLSTSDQVVNPYLGNKHPKYKATMLNCGDLADSLDFRHKP